MTKWVAALDVSVRDSDWGPVGEHVDCSELVPTVELRTLHGERIQDVRERWLTLTHPNLLDAVGWIGDSGMRLRYPAIHWGHPNKVDEHAFPDDYIQDVTASVFARWVVELADVYRMFAQEVPVEDWPLLWRPRTLIDLDGAIRVALGGPDRFEPPDETLDERSLVYVVGAAVAARCSSMAPKMKRVLERCVEPKPRKRYSTLAELQSVCLKIRGTTQRVRAGIQLEAWRRLEVGLGWFVMARYEAALAHLRVANAMAPSDLTGWAVAEAAARATRVRLDATRPTSLPVGPQNAEWGVALSPAGLPTRAVKPRRSERQGTRGWSRVEVQVRACVDRHDYRSAIALLYDVRVTEADARIVFGHRARCHLALREYGPAIDFAQRAIAAGADERELGPVLLAAQLESHRLDDASGNADAFVAKHPDHAKGHYLHGRILLGLGRLDDALAALDRSIRAGATTEAVVMRGQVDRTIRALGRVVGSQNTELAIPESLREVADVLASGDSARIIAALDAPGFVDNADAQLVLARFSGFAGDHERAIAIYDRLMPVRRAEALVGKASALLDQDKADSALALLEVACSEQPADPDACDARARALEKLGRMGEAAAEFRRFLSLATAGADLRVRSAQLWLDRH